VSGIRVPAGDIVAGHIFQKRWFRVVSGWIASLWSDIWESRSEFNAALTLFITHFASM
jgi:hypothetical protein